MNELNSWPTPKREGDEIQYVSKVQLSGMMAAAKSLENVLQSGIMFIDIEKREKLFFEVEDLADYYVPVFLNNFRHFFYFSHDNNENRSEFLELINYLLTVSDQSKEYLERCAASEHPDITPVVQAHLGYFRQDIDFLEHKMYTENTEILQLSFNSTTDLKKRAFVDKGYWFDFKSRKIHYVCKIRAFRAARHIKRHNTEFDILKLKKLFLYPGKINNRVRWNAEVKRETTAKDIAVVIGSARTDYANVVNEIKENFREPLAERTPALLIKLHKAFINGDYLVLEDEQGGLLTVTDSPKDNTPTTELLQAILPAQPVGCALLVEVNDDLQSGLFSVKPLSFITPDKIIRLSY